MACEDGQGKIPADVSLFLNVEKLKVDSLKVKFIHPSTFEHKP
jgi:hypothetical protein